MLIIIKSENCSYTSILQFLFLYIFFVNYLINSDAIPFTLLGTSSTFIIHGMGPEPKAKPLLKTIKETSGSQVMVAAVSSSVCLM